MRSSCAHCDPELVKRIAEKLGEEDWRDTWRSGLARHLAKRMSEEEEEKKKEEEKQRALMKSRNPHLAGRRGKKHVNNFMWGLYMSGPAHPMPHDKVLPEATHLLKYFANWRTDPPSS